MSAHDDSLPAVPEGDEPIPNPGLPAHQYRPTDVDAKQEKRAERQVAAFFGVATLALLGFFVSYFAFQVGDNWDTIAGFGASNLMLGGTLGIAFLCIGIGLVHWARKLMNDQELVELRHPASSSEEDRTTTVGLIDAGHRRLRHRPPSAGAQLAAGRARPGRAGPDRDAARPGPAAR